MSVRARPSRPARIARLAVECLSSRSAVRALDYTGRTLNARALIAQLSVAGSPIHSQVQATIPSHSLYYYSNRLWCNSF